MITQSHNNIVISFDEYNALINDLSAKQQIIAGLNENQKKVHSVVEKHIINNSGAQSIRHTEISRNYINFDDVIDRVKNETAQPLLDKIKLMEFNYATEVEKLHSRLSILNRDIIDKEVLNNSITTEFENERTLYKNEITDLQLKLTKSNIFHHEEMQKITDYYERIKSEQDIQITNRQTELFEKEQMINLLNHTIKNQKIKTWKEYLPQSLRRLF